MLPLNGFTGSPIPCDQKPAIGFVVQVGLYIGWSGRPPALGMMPRIWWAGVDGVLAAELVGEPPASAVAPGEHAILVEADRRRELVPQRFVERPVDGVVAVLVVEA